LLILLLLGACTTKLLPFNSLKSHKSIILSERVDVDRDGYYFIVEIGVGMMRIPVQFIVDTGSSVSWISRGLCEKREELRSICAQADNGEDGYAEYIDGRVEGKWTKLSLYFSEQNIESINHHILIVNSTNPSLPQALIGLSKSSNPSHPTLLDTLLSNSIIPSLQYSLFKVSPGHYNLNIGSSTYPARIDNKPSIDIPSVDGMLVMVDVEGIRVGNSSVIGKVRRGVIDSGNSLLSIPGEYSLSLLNSLKIQGLDCSFSPLPYSNRFSVLACNTQTVTIVLPSVSVLISSTVFTIPGSALIDKCVLSLLGDMFTDNSEYTCTTRIEIEEGGDRIRLGRPFMEAVDVGVEMEGMKIKLGQN